MAETFKFPDEQDDVKVTTEDDQTDEQIIDLIVNRPNNWMPLWREGTSEQMKNFIMMCLEADPFKRGDKLQYINHPYIM